MYKFIQHIFILGMASVCLGQNTPSVCELADSSIAHKDYKAAIPLLKKCIPTTEDSLAYYFKMTHCYGSLDLPDSVLYIYDYLITQYPTAIELYNYKADYLHHLGLYKQAVESYTEALRYIRNDTQKLEVYVNRAVSARSYRKFDLALADLDSAFRMDSTSAGILSNIASIHDDLGNIDLSIKYYKRALLNDPTFYGTYNNYGFLLQRIGRHKEALKNFKIIMEKEPNPYTICNMSYSKLQLGDVNGAYNDIMKSIEMDPYNSYAYKVRALIWIRKKQTSKACDDINKALELGYTEKFGSEASDLKAKYCK